MGGCSVERPVNKPRKIMFKVAPRKLTRVPVVDKINGVSVITCTNKPKFLKNIVENFLRQGFEPKELIVVINLDSISVDSIKDYQNNYKNITFYVIRSHNSLGKCLNYAISQAKYNVIAKFDDDDYYSEYYLTEAIEALNNTGASVIGKGSTLVYFISKKILAIRGPNLENRYVNFVNGSTLVFRREIFKKVHFKDISVGEDVQFCNECRRKKIRIYSTSKYNHVYVRNPNKSNHTWKIRDDTLLSKYCSFLCTTDDFTHHVLKTD